MNSRFNNELNMWKVLDTCFLRIIVKNAWGTIGEGEFRLEEIMPNHASCYAIAGWGPQKQGHLSYWLTKFEPTSSRFDSSIVTVYHWCLANIDKYTVYVCNSMLQLPEQHEGHMLGLDFDHSFQSSPWEDLERPSNNRDRRQDQRIHSPRFLDWLIQMIYS